MPELPEGVTRWAPDHDYEVMEEVDEHFLGESFVKITNLPEIEAAARREGAEEERERLREALVGAESMLAWPPGGKALLVNRETFERIFAAFDTPAPSEPEEGKS